MSRRTLTASLVAALSLLSVSVRADNDYMVEKGDSLIKIGNLFGVPYKELMRVNNLKSTTIYPDQIIRIPAGGRTTDRDIAAATYAAEQEEARAQAQVPALVTAKAENRSYSSATPTEHPSYSQTAYIPPVQGASKSRPSSGKAPETSVAREGDTLWSIGRRFGVETNDLKKMNNIEFSKIEIGQVLTIPGHVAIASN